MNGIKNYSNYMYTIVVCVCVYWLPRWFSGYRIHLQCRRLRRPGRVQFLSGKDALEEGMATHSSILPQSIPWTQETGRLQSIGSQRVRHN